MEHLIEVAFKGNRREFFRWTFEAPPPARAAIIVETERGEDLGHVHATGELAGTRRTGTTHGKEQKEPLRLALRLASGDDIARANVNRVDEEEARRYAVQKARALDLQMKVSDAEWQWDRRRLTFYFTAEERVDFRALVRQLESHFGVRVQMWHIGPRDEAKRLDGVGHCGRQLCSAAWLPELLPVKTSLAKDQRLSTITPTQISGACGRLMCCLRYEHEFYAQARKRFPKHGKIVTTLQGEEKIDNTDIFRDLVTLRSPGGDTRTIPLAQFKRELAGEAMPVEEETHDDADGLDEMPRDLVRTPQRPLAQLQRAPEPRRTERPEAKSADRAAEPQRPREQRARDERPRDERPRDERPRDDRPRDERPRDDRPREHKPRDERPRPDRPRHEPRAAEPARTPSSPVPPANAAAPTDGTAANDAAANDAAANEGERRARRRRGRRGGRRHRGPDGSPGGERPPQNPE